MIGGVSRIYERVEMAETTLEVAARWGTHIGATRTRVRVPTCRRRRESSVHTYIAVVCCRSVTFLTRADSIPIFALFAAVSGYYLRQTISKFWINNQPSCKNMISRLCTLRSYRSCIFAKQLIRRDQLLIFVEGSTILLHKLLESY